MMDFGYALVMVKSGARIARDGWNGKGQYVEAQIPDEHSKMTRPYLYITTVQGDRVPWIASQTDMLADDWRIVPRVGYELDPARYDPNQAEV